MYLRTPQSTSLNATVTHIQPLVHLQLRVAGPPTFAFKKKKKIKWKNLLARTSLWSCSGGVFLLFSSLHTAPSQGGVKQDVGRRGLDGGGVDLRHLVVVELEPALFGGILTVGCVMATVQTPVVVLVGKEHVSGYWQ